MIKFNVSEMTCGHCVSVISKAILSLQDDAKLDADLTNHTLSVTSELTADEIVEVLNEAGYAATELKATCCSTTNKCHS
ncbi:heavy-metal-associated domain-containing protein [Vibrio diazotrophicus]|uniref:heavy-metal-associated domain-containing protein n=1 Tax=Vibrio diazotrophicus TaxID=685 RepID=UPI000C9EA772|nr:heavy-metal-associated domain-containing protein [Vibrio diazotrophicus]PNH89746.1 heavy metal transporter [Vibrio diazotrophicus]